MAQEFDFDIGNVVGPKGDTGNGIASIELLSTSGLNKTYRITMTDETTFDFVVTDGNGITGATFDAQTNALTLTFDNGTSFTTPSLKGTKGDTGNGISRIEKTGTAGLVDTYTVTYTNGQTFTYTVTNGADGVSPEVTVTPISGGHAVEIEDADGVKTFNVLDGEVTEARMAEALATKAPVILETASGAIASFSDGADSMPIKKLVAKIEPVQDLHGYDNPWPAGGGVNKAPVNDFSGKAFRAMDFDPVLPIGTYTFSYNATRTGTSTNDAGVVIHCEDGTDINRSIFVDGTRRSGNFTAESPVQSLYFYSIAGSYAQSQDYTLTVSNFQLESGSTATAYSPYSNICPISGHTGAEIYDDPAYGGLVNWNQICKPIATSRTQTTNGIIFTDNRDGTYTVSTESGGATAYTFIVVDDAVDRPRHKFVLLGCPSGGNFNSYTLRLRGQGQDAIDSGSGAMWNAENNSYKSVVVAIKQGVVIRTPLVFKPQLIDLTQMFGTTVADYIYNLEQTTAGAGVAWFRNLFPKDYYAYNAGEEMTVSAVNSDEYNQISVNWKSEAGTIYGGTVTLNEDGSADVVSTHVTYDIQPSQWTWMATFRGFKIDRTSLSPRYTVFGSNADSRVVDIVSNKYKPNSFNNIGNGYGSPNYSVGIREYNAQWLALRTDGTNGVLPEECQIKLPLAIPQTYHFDNIGQLNTFLGTNNVWTNTGDTEVTYPADTRLFIEKLTQPTEDDMTANANIAANTFFMIGNTLYFSTAAIAQGATIIPGTNCNVVSLADALNQLNT